MTVDLHMHTDASDGTDSAERAIEKASTAGIGIVAVTDHDGVDSVAEAIACGARRGIGVLTGVELSTRFKDYPVDLLAYGFDTSNPGLTEAMNKNRENFNNIVVEALTAIEQDIPEVNVRDFEAYFERSSRYSSRFYKVHAYLRSRCPGVQTGRYFKWRNVFSVQELCRRVDEADGFPVVAHPGLSFSRLDSSQLVATLVELKQAGVAGIECFHPNHKVETQALLKRWSVENRMLITAGSDYHGDGHVSSRLIGVPLSELEITPLLERI